VGLGGATTVWCPTGEWRERERRSLLIYRRKKKKVFAMIFFRNDDL
jgi:hypothetical protein